MHARRIDVGTAAGEGGLRGCAARGKTCPRAVLGTRQTAENLLCKIELVNRIIWSRGALRAAVLVCTNSMSMFVASRRALRHLAYACRSSPASISRASSSSFSSASSVSASAAATTASLLRDASPSSVIVMVGAGLSCSAGIPDFRTPGTGLYDNLETYNLPYAEAIFDLDYFREHPDPFYLLCRSLWPGSFAPTPAHHFLRLLHDKGLLRRVYTVRHLSFVFAPP